MCLNDNSCAEVPKALPECPAVVLKLQKVMCIPGRGFIKGQGQEYGDRPFMPLTGWTMSEVLG